MLENTPLSGIEVRPGGARLLLGGAGGASLDARLVLDVMGNASPVVRQQRWGQRPDGVCCVVGTCAAGFPAEGNTTGDIIYTAADSLPPPAGGRPGNLQLYWVSWLGGLRRWRRQMEKASAHTTRIAQIAVPPPRLFRRRSPRAQAPRTAPPTCSPTWMPPLPAPPSSRSWRSTGARCRSTRAWYCMIWRYCGSSLAPSPRTATPPCAPAGTACSRAATPAGSRAPSPLAALAPSRATCPASRRPWQRRSGPTPSTGGPPAGVLLFSLSSDARRRRRCSGQEGHAHRTTALPALQGEPRRDQ